MIPPEHQDLSLKKGTPKWQYEINTLWKAYGIGNPADDLVRMFANRRVTAEQKVWYVQQALRP